MEGLERGGCGHSKRKREVKWIVVRNNNKKKFCYFPFSYVINSHLCWGFIWAFACFSSFKMGHFPSNSFLSPTSILGNEEKLRNEQRLQHSEPIPYFTFQVSSVGMPINYLNLFGQSHSTLPWRIITQAFYHSYFRVLTANDCQHRSLLGCFFL